jgi:PhnB protein
MSNITLDPYLFFTGNCREAMEFYKTVFGGELTFMTYDEMPQEDLPKNMDGKISHAFLSGGEIKLMASDSTRESFGESFISLTLGGSESEKLHSLFDKLAEGGKVVFPITPQPWGDDHGALTDKFGVDWMVNISK